VPAGPSSRTLGPVSTRRATYAYGMWRGLAYLTGNVVTALPLLLRPSPWADRHRRRAARLLDVPVDGTPSRRTRAWPLVHGALSPVSGLLVVVCAGNAVASMITIPLWWAFPPDTRLRFLFDGPHLSGWGTVLTLGIVQAVGFAALTCLGIGPLARAHARICLAMLAPSPADRLSERVDVLTRTRTGVLDAHAAELRRIERDLHDGTQARLVAIAMRLGVARESLAGDPAMAADLLREAHEGTEAAMAELREVVRTIYPPILADRGLVGALTALATRPGLPVHLDVGDLGTVPAAVETVAYFTVAEALTNVAKHSRATRVTVGLDRRDDRMSVEVTDDGVGGADQSRGTGLAGIGRRVAALDGRVLLHSPPGGPTRLFVELPCGS
jgi:signal transduction histidine kinase